MVPTVEKAQEKFNAASTAYLSLATDPVSKFLNAPFATWQSTFILAWAVIFLAACTAFLANRYIEVLSYPSDVTDDAPLTLEGQRPRRARSIARMAPTALNGSPITSFAYLDLYDVSDLRHRGNPALDLTAVTIGDVSSGRIAQRRASTPKTPKAVKDQYTNGDGADPATKST
jgi:hypothetical protein